MAERKQTPDILGEVLGQTPQQAVAGPVAESDEAALLRAVPVEATASRRQAGSAPRPGTVQDGVSHTVPWEFLIVSFQEHNGWRPRYVNGEELEDWTALPVIHEYANLVGAAGWELAGASDGALYGLMDERQLMFKRVRVSSL
jgi:hypothetical protein